MAGPATENAQWPSIVHCWCGTSSWWRHAELHFMHRGCDRLTSVTLITFFLQSNECLQPQMFLNYHQLSNSPAYNCSTAKAALFRVKCTFNPVHYNVNWVIHTAVRCKLEIKLVWHIDIRRVQFNSSTDSLLQQQEQRSDTSNAVYHCLPTNICTNSIICTYLTIIKYNVFYARLVQQQYKWTDQSF